MEIINHNLSLISFIYGLIDNIKSYNGSPTSLLNFYKKNFPNSKNISRKDISKKTIFTNEELEIINKSLLLSDYIKKNNLIDLNSLSIEILSFNDINSNEDIKVNNKIFKIDFKPINFGNLDIFRILHLFTNLSTYDNKNIIEFFAKEELDMAFRKGCDILIEELIIKSYESRLTKIAYISHNDKLYFFYQGQEHYVENFSNINYDNFFDNIPSSYLKSFANCFEEKVKHNIEYIKYKELYLYKLKNELEKIIQNKPKDLLLNNLLFSLFKLNLNPYYLLNLSKGEINCLGVPSRDEFIKNFEVFIQDIFVEKGSLNINIIVENKINLFKFELNNIFDYHNGEFISIPNIKSIINESFFSNIYNKLV